MMGKFTLTPKKIVAVCVAVVGCVAAFQLLNPSQATAVTTLIGAIAAIWDSDE